MTSYTGCASCAHILWNGPGFYDPGFCLDCGRQLKFYIRPDLARQQFFGFAREALK